MTHNPNHISELLDQYGSDPANWPEGERKTMADALAASPALQKQGLDNAAIDETLATPPPDAPLLQARLLRDFRQHHQSPPLLTGRRLSLLAASFLFGLLLGGLPLPMLGDNAAAAPVETIFTPLMADPFTLFLDE